MPRPAGTDHNSLASKARIALRTDLDKLMEQFLLTESIRYQEFARVWQQLNFALIYAGLKDSKEKREFIIDAYDLVSEYLQPPFDLQRRVCALYTLYGLYYTQTHHPRIKVRMSLEDWKETLALHDDLQEQGHLDALYIFHKMRLDKAFMFTATHSNMYYLGKGAKKPEDFEKWAAKHQSFMASVLDEDLLQELEHVHSSYQNGKQTFEEDPSMAIVKESMSDFIMERISNIDVPQKSEESDSDALQESRTRASLLREIKKRSFASPTKTSHARRSKTTTDDSGTDDPTYRPTKSRSKRAKRRGRPPKMDAKTTKGRKTESDTSNSSPSKKRKLDSTDKSSVKKIKKEKTPAKKSNGDETVQSPGHVGSKVKKSGQKKKIQSPDDGESKVKTSKRKKKVESPGNDKSKETKKRSRRKSKDDAKKNGISKKAEKSQDKTKKKLFTDEVDDSLETPSTSKGKRPKRTNKKDAGQQVKSPPAKATKDQSRSKKPSPDSKESIEVKVKVETPSKTSSSAPESPRKRPRKSSTPKRITRSHEKL